MMFNQTIRIATFNCLASWPVDEEKISTESAEGENFKIPEEVHCSSDPVTRIEQLIANKLADHMDVICLQGTKDLERPFCRALKDREFTLYRLESNEIEIFPENIIAIRNTMPNVQIENISKRSLSNPKKNPKGCGQQIAAVIIRMDRQFSLAIASLHSWEFALYPEGATEKIYSKEDLDSMNYACAYMEEAIDLVNQYNPSFAVLAGDFNNNMHNFRKPFDLLKKERFSIHEPGQNDSTSPFTCSTAHRNTNYICTTLQQSISTKSSAWIPSMFYQTFSIETTPVQPVQIFAGCDFPLNNDGFFYQTHGISLSIREQSSWFSSLTSRASQISTRILSCVSVEPAEEYAI
jgi:hypothetical protein